MDNSTPKKPKPEKLITKSKYTHDLSGKPLPDFILNGSVAYEPMIPKPRPVYKPKFNA